jgi:hypothetical protein
LYCCASSCGSPASSCGGALGPAPVRCGQP